MSTPLQYYNSIPPVAKAYAVTCLLFTGACHLQLYDVGNIALSYSAIFKRFQVMAIIPYFWSPFMGSSLVFVLAYIWGREFPNARVNVHGLFELKGFYIPYYMLVVDLVLGIPLKPGCMGIAAGHLYYFLTVLYPLSTGKNIFKTPRWVNGRGPMPSSSPPPPTLVVILFNGHSLNKFEGGDLNDRCHYDLNHNGRNRSDSHDHLGRGHKCYVAALMVVTDLFKIEVGGDGMGWGVPYL
ncbi:hypothetical protein RD792_005207 [Penstemon davidsonii]|uniref:Derlin n=1 Tax=Penstemon davidsonii TaxID=160366 RepID=A0ABR0DKV9_9LAMI|nr:hypothetical protein RD792_005207 [Penstemon davidsonii]